MVAYAVCLSAAAALTIGNVLPLSQIPEGTVISNVEARPGDRGSFGRTSGGYVVVVSQDEDKGITKVRLPSGAKKNVPSSCRAQVRRSRTMRIGRIGRCRSDMPLHPLDCRGVCSRCHFVEVLWVCLSDPCCWLLVLSDDRSV